MTENKAAAATPAETTAPAQENPQALVTVDDLVIVVKFLEQLANLKRLTDLEIAGLKPSFDRIVAFLNMHQQQAAAQTAAADPVTQTEEKLLDLPPAGKGKKKSSKKK